MIRQLLESFIVREHTGQDSRSLYSVGEVACLAHVHPETLRVWDRRGILNPIRQNGRRLYSAMDLRRVDFILQLLQEGMNLSGVKHYLSFYPCWWHYECPPCVSTSATPKACSKPCWKEKGTYCTFVPGVRNPCASCEIVRAAERALRKKDNSP